MNKNKGKQTNYIDNTELYTMFTEWTDRNSNIPECIAKAILQICDNLARSGKFCGYTWKDDMIGDAVVSCVRGARNFDCTKSKNPFAYFTSIAWNAFRHRINMEHARLNFQEKYKQEIQMFDSESYEDDEDYNYINNNIQNYAYQHIKKYGKQKKSVAHRLDGLFEGE